ncbi:hypothetical protein PENTCL1PPCAC_23353, partial [Pristionchus entomophagus]
ASDTPICGNGIVETGEECDCGYDEKECEEAGDKCCGPAHFSDGLGCKLKKGAFCSPSQGGCCNEDCYLKGYGEECAEETDCALSSKCTGWSYVCPSPQMRNENEPCE